MVLPYYCPHLKAGEMGFKTGRISWVLDQAPHHQKLSVSAVLLAPRASPHTWATLVAAKSPGDPLRMQGPELCLPTEVLYM